MKFIIILVLTVIIIIIVFIILKLKDNYLSSKSKIWKKSFFKKNPLIIKFLPYGYPYYDDDIPRIDRIYHSKFKKDQNGNEIKWDPLEYELQNTDFKKAIIKIVLERLSPIVNIPFKFVTDDFDNNKTHIRISFNPEETCFSAIGTDCLKIDKELSTMNFGWFDVGSVLHEFGHALGLEHEHQSPNADINWNIDEVYKHYKKQGKNINDINKHILNKKDNKNVNANKFDLESIMLYSYPKKLTNDMKGTKQNQRLSPVDVLHLAKLYPKQDDPNFIKLAKWYCKIYDYKEDFFEYNK